jgi:hypothetical protein
MRPRCSRLPHWSDTVLAESVQIPATHHDNAGPPPPSSPRLSRRRGDARDGAADDRGDERDEVDLGDQWLANRFRTTEKESSRFSHPSGISKSATAARTYASFSGLYQLGYHEIEQTDGQYDDRTKNAVATSSRITGSTRRAATTATRRLP